MGLSVENVTVDNVIMHNKPLSWRIEISLGPILSSCSAEAFNILLSGEINNIFLHSRTIWLCGLEESTKAHY